MKDTILWIFLIVGIAGSLVLLKEGVKKWSQGNRKFNFEDLFKGVSLKASSGSLLIVEGIFGLACAVIFYFLYIF